MKNIPTLIGKLGYVISYPALMLWLRGSQRVYLVLRVGDEILVTKNWLGMQKKWRLPGGGLVKNEATTDGLRREVSEELGIDISLKAIKQLGHTTYSAAPGYTYTIFILNCQGKPEFSPNKHEISAIAWMTRSELQKQQLSNELHTALTLLP